MFLLIGRGAPVIDAAPAYAHTSHMAIAAPAEAAPHLISTSDDDPTPETGTVQASRLYFPGIYRSPPAGPVAQIGGSIDAVAVMGNRIYAGMGPRLVVFDVSNPASPRLLGRSPILPGLVSGIAVENSVAYVAAGPEGGQPAGPLLAEERVPFLLAHRDHPTAPLLSHRTPSGGTP